jgi:hypothetical protein
MNRPSSTDPEPVWSQWLAQEWGGVAEFRTFDGSRVDVLTDTYLSRAYAANNTPNARTQSQRPCCAEIGSDRQELG